MRVRTQAFHVPKQGNADEEYEDAYFPGTVEETLAEFRCAVADGASESAYSGQWAQLLVEGFSRRQLQLAQLRAQWEEAIKGQPLPWFLEKKVHRGAYAALIGLAIRERDGLDAAQQDDDEAKLSAADWLPPSETPGAVEPEPGRGWHSNVATVTPAEIAGSWRALAVGDSCLFQVRENELVTVGPRCKSDQFDNAPFLLGSKSKETLRRSADHVSIHSGTWAGDDRFYLATDALSQWLLLRHEAGLAPWEMLRELGADDTRPFEDLIAEMRCEHDLHNDDTTLLRLEVGE